MWDLSVTAKQLSHDSIHQRQIMSKMHLANHSLFFMSNRHTFRCYNQIAKYAPLTIATIMLTNNVGFISNYKTTTHEQYAFGKPFSIFRTLKR